MITAKFDNAPVKSKAGQRRSATDYLRGTVGEVDNPAMQHLVGRRVLMWSDTDDIEPFIGKVANFVCDLRDEIQMEGSGQKTIVIANVATRKVLTDDEALDYQAKMMEAQAKNLSERGTRLITRQQPAAATTETAQNVADAALTEVEAGAEEKAPI